MTRNIPIDTLRGVACILLVAFHVVGGQETGLRLDPSHPLSEINNVLIYLRMPLFSFLSGFVYGWRPYRGEPGKFVKAKVRRLLVPMLLVGTLFAVLQSLTPGVNGSSYDWSMLHILPVAHFWFLESLFIVFMVTAVLERFGLLSTPARLLTFWLAAVILFMTTALTDILGINGAVYLFPYFLLGLACNRFGEQLKQIPVGWMAAGLLGFVLYLVFADQGLPEWNSLTAVLLGTGSCVVLLRSRIQVRWLAWVGYFSFAIYLFHSMFSAASRIVLVRLGVESVPVLFASGLLLGLLGPILAYLVLRRLPLGHLPLGEPFKAKAKPRALPVQRDSAQTRSTSAP
jgi:peptidoglycan/LPS O-acetylase OafA/YrhL